jgi:hypothetical protein
MGGSTYFGVAFAKAQSGGGAAAAASGTAFVSVNNDDKANLLPIARDLAELGFRLIATRGTAAYLRAYGLGRRRRLQGERGAAEHRGRDRQPQGRSRDQHAARPRVVLRRPHRPPRRDDARGAVYHHADRRRRRGERHSRRCDSRGSACRALQDYYAQTITQRT